MADIKIRTGFSNGSLTILPAPEKAYNDQIHNIRAIPKVVITGIKEPTSACWAIASPAPKNLYQSGPPMTIPMCVSEIKAVKMPA